MSLNKVMLIGNCGKDPDVRHLESGSVTASFTLATTERYKDRNGDTKEQTEWHNIVCWRGLAEIAEKYVRKGTPLFIEGRLRYRSYNDKDGNLRYITEIQADSFQMLGKKSDNQPTPLAQVQYPQAKPQSSSATAQVAQQPIALEQTSNSEINADDVDDLPF